MAAATVLAAVDMLMFAVKALQCYSRGRHETDHACHISGAIAGVAIAEPALTGAWVCLMQPFVDKQSPLFCITAASFSDMVRAVGAELHVIAWSRVRIANGGRLLAEVEGRYLAEVAAWRWPVLMVIFVFDLFVWCAVFDSEAFVHVHLLISGHMHSTSLARRSGLFHVCKFLRAHLAHAALGKRGYTVALVSHTVTQRCSGFPQFGPYAGSSEQRGNWCTCLQSHATPATLTTPAAPASAASTHSAASCASCYRRFATSSLCTASSAA